MNPFNSLTPQSKLLGAVIMVVGIVVSAPHTAFSAGAVVLLVSALAIIAEARIGQMLLRSLVVLPVAGMLSLFYPLRFVAELTPAAFVTAYATYWQPMLALIVTPWLCVLVMMFLMEICTQEDILYAMECLHLPHILVLLLTFMFRYVDVMRYQLRASRRALVSRAPGLSARRQVMLYGNLAGSMLIRAYDQGERIHAAMLSRGYTGILPRLRSERMAVPDAIFLVCTIVFACGLLLYH